MAGTLPRGYEPKTGNTLGFDPAISQVEDLGYTASARFDFLNSSSVDPVDLPASARVGSRIDLSLPFFPDNDVRSEQSEWMKFTAAANQHAIEDLTSRLKGPVLIESRRAIRDFVSNGYSLLVPWNPGEPFPTLESEVYGGASAPNFGLIRVSDSMSPLAEHSLWQKFTSAGDSKQTLALDLTEIPPNHLTKLLDSWVRTAHPRP